MTRACLFALATAPLPGIVGAQACFLPHPSPACRWFWLTEAGSRWPLARPSGAARRQEYFWHLGVAKNVGSASAVGAALAFSTDYVESGTYRLALEARYRRWLTPLVLDVGAGPILGPAGLSGISTHTSLGYRSLAAFDAGFDAHRRNLTGRTTDGYLGIRFGSLPGLVFGVVAPIVLVVRALGSGPD